LEIFHLFYELPYHPLPLLRHHGPLCPYSYVERDFYHLSSTEAHQSQTLPDLSLYLHYMQQRTDRCAHICLMDAQGVCTEFEMRTKLINYKGKFF
jgi:hypothetical protein